MGTLGWQGTHSAISHSPKEEAYRCHLDIGTDWLCVITGAEHRDNGLLKLRKWTRILLRNPTIPRPASQVLETESLGPEPSRQLLCVWGGCVGREWASAGCREGAGGLAFFTGCGSHAEAGHGVPPKGKLPPQEGIKTTNIKNHGHGFHPNSMRSEQQQEQQNRTKKNKRRKEKKERKEQNSPSW